MTNPAASRKRTSSGTTKSPRRAAASPAKGVRTAKKQAARPPRGPGGDGQHAITLTIPFDRVAATAGTIAMAPIAVARKVLPAKGGLPLYLGLGALGAVGVLDWPVAVGVGLGYAVLRRGGPLNPAPAEK